MATEQLSVPEEHLLSVISVIRSGLHWTRGDIPDVVFEQLTQWCDEEEEYITR